MVDLEVANVFENKELLESLKLERIKNYKKEINSILSTLDWQFRFMGLITWVGLAGLLRLERG